MLSYETLDRIADAVNPTFAIVALLLPWFTRGRDRRWRIAQTLFLFAAVAVAYLGRAVDGAFALWARAGLDYSTHAAVYVAIAAALWQHGSVWRGVSVVVGLVYAALMIWQKYHSLADILTTIAVIIAATSALWWATRRLETSESLA